MGETACTVGRVAAWVAGKVGGLSPVPSEPPQRARWSSAGLAKCLYPIMYGVEMYAVTRNRPQGGSHHSRAGPRVIKCVSKSVH